MTLALVHGTVRRVEVYRDAFLAEVLRTFVWALPHQYAAPASAGTTVQVDLGAGRGRRRGGSHISHIHVMCRATREGFSRVQVDSPVPADPPLQAAGTGEGRPISADRADPKLTRS